MIDPALRKLAVPIDSVQPHPRNEHHQGDVGAIVMSLRRFGQVRPIVVQKSTGFVCAGNHVWKAMKAEGESKIAVVTPDLSDEEALAYLIADNRTPELGTTDDQGLAEILTELQAAGLLDGTGYDDEDLGRLLDDLARDAGGREVDEGAGVPDRLTENPVSGYGEVYELGPHRLMCGDATDPAAMAILMDGVEASCLWTDPPYGVDYVGKTSEALTINGDRPQTLPALLQRVFATSDEVLRPGAPLYVAHPAGALFQVFTEAFLAAGWEYRQGLVWDKETMVLGHADYHYSHEPIIYGYKPVASGRLGRGKGSRGWLGDNAQVSVFRVPKPSRSEQHPTMKPVELVRQMLANSLPRDGIVLDPFAGAGSTMLAAHALDRRAYLMEIDPRYCDVVRARYEAAALNVPTTVTTGA